MIQTIKAFFSEATSSRHTDCFKKKLQLIQWWGGRSGTWLTNNTDQPFTAYKSVFPVFPISLSLSLSLSHSLYRYYLYLHIYLCTRLSHQISITFL